MDVSIKYKWQEFVKREGKKAYEKIDEFLTNFEKEYKINKIKEFENAGVGHAAAIGKARQSWVVYVGNNLEMIIAEIISPLIKRYNAKIVRGKEIDKSKLNKELDAVRRGVLVNFDKGYSYVPDADLIVYRYNEKNEKADILAILSIKNSFRERYTETPYWKIKLGQSEITRGIKIYMVTPDRDNEISSREKPSKARVVLEYELDGVYIAKHKDEIDITKKVGDIEALLCEIEKLLS